MKARGVALAALCALALLVAGVATAQVRDTTVRADTTFSGARAEARAVRQADSLRTAILSLATFAGFATAPCAPGDLRTFERDSTGASKRLLARLELLVLSYGVAEPVDTPLGKALLRAVVRLETGGPGPRWDVTTGTGPRAFNPILATSLYNSETKECVDTPGNDPFGLVLPSASEFVPPRDSGAVEYVVAYGAGGLNELRDLFHSAFGRDSVAVMRHTRVVAHAIWGNYAMIGVQRDAERHGAVPLPAESTGASYLFHHVDGEWRMIGVVRNW